MKFLVNIEEILSRDIILEANSEEDAENKAWRLYRNCEIVLNADDFIGKPTIKCIALKK